MSDLGHQFATASTLASLAQLTRLTSLNWQGSALGNIQLTFLHSLADLAVCLSCVQVGTIRVHLSITSGT